ncbi:COG3650 family protein [Croceicoccus bisphenolivorans]|uniref:COG3650 family protein n=1 Tax=Croceicoccus bisphenolivorans TaxID=1783232 RepID=UPI00083630C1|nr:hypothetical protein [Croceicoccus bisphenolivorans]
MKSIAVSALCAFALSSTLAACGSGPGDGSVEPSPQPSSSAAPATPATNQPGIDSEDETQPDGFPAGFRALGTEPFWAVHVGDGHLRYMTPEDQQGQSLPYTSEQTPQDEFALTAMLGNEELVLSGKVGECSDGMSDRSYPYTVSLRIGDRNLQGCGRPTDQ